MDVTGESSVGSRSQVFHATASFCCFSDMVVGRIIGVCPPSLAPSPWIRPSKPNYVCMERQELHPCQELSDTTSYKACVRLSSTLVLL